MRARLFTPGPTPVPEYVQQEIQKPIIYHRDEEFVTLFHEIVCGIKELLQTKYNVLVFTCSGSGGLEAVIVNLFSKNDEVAVVDQGKFSARMVDICNCYGLSVVKMEIEWGQSVSIGSVKNVLAQHSDVKAFIMPHCETSTGAVNDLQALSTFIHNQSSAVLIVDAISSIGAMPFFMDEWNIDAVVTSSNKGLLNPPGLAFVGLNNRAWQLHEQSDQIKYYFDFTRAKKAYESGTTTPFTPAIPLVRGVKCAIGEIQKKGLKKTWQRHKEISQACREAFKKMDMEIFPENSSASVTVVKLPATLQADIIIRDLRNRYHFVVANGQGKLKNKVIRIGHFGNYTSKDVAELISSLGSVFVDNGWNISPVSAVQSFYNALSKNE